MTEFSKVYGGALYALAVEENKEESILHDLETVCALLRQQPEYAKLIDSRAVEKSERITLLDQAFAGQVDAYLLNFMKILCERDAFASLSQCAEAFESAYNEKHHIAVANVVSAQPLNDEQMARLQCALEEKTGKSIKLATKVDPQLGGGLRVEMEGHRYDNTVAAKLDRLRKALLSQS